MHPGTCAYTPVGRACRFEAGVRAVSRPGVRVPTCVVTVPDRNPPTGPPSLNPDKPTLRSYSIFLPTPIQANRDVREGSRTLSPVPKSSRFHPGRFPTEGIDK